MAEPHAPVHTGNSPAIAVVVEDPNNGKLNLGSTTHFIPGPNQKNTVKQVSWIKTHCCEIGVVLLAILGGVFAYLAYKGLLGEVPSKLGPNGVLGITLGLGLTP